MDYKVKIDEFEGPLDLLLHLIKEENIDIYNISIDKITKEYLEYIKAMEDLNINVAASYLIMAAELMEIKSSSLLPNLKKEEENSDEIVSTKENLINRLVEYQKYKEVSKSFKDLESLRNDFYIKSPENVKYYIDDKINSNDSIDNLMDAFYKYLDRKNKEKPLVTKVTNREYNIENLKKHIREILNKTSKIEFSKLFYEYNKSYMVTTFLSILQMSKDNEITITQENNFASIYIEKR